MTGKYFTRTVKPLIQPHYQVTQFNRDDVIFDFIDENKNYCKFTLPQSTAACRLMGVTALVRGHNGVRDEFGMELLFAKSSGSGNNPPGAVGVPNATADGNGYQNQLIGATTIDTGDFKDGLDIMAVATTRSLNNEIIIESEGLDKTHTIYVAGISLTASKPDFTDDIYSTGTIATSTKVIGSLDDGSGGSPSIENKFDVGDVIYQYPSGSSTVGDGNLLGTIASIDSATQFTLVDNCANGIVDNARLFNVHPITLILSFES
tara:strand:- start:44 stop:829 length:786 start_codon:yes stop_codon:yes gene_type:complete